MRTETTITPEEIEIIHNIAGRFARTMRWNPRWEFEDIRQELSLFWLTRKQSGWKKPQEWKGAMGRCLKLHLKDLQRRECAEHSKTNGSLASLDGLMVQGFDIPTETKPATLPLDFLNLLNSRERLICEFLIKGMSKKAIAARIGKSRPFVHQRLKYVRHLAEQLL